jgi:hypothetical protein
MLKLQNTATRLTNHYGHPMNPSRNLTRSIAILAGFLVLICAGGCASFKPTRDVAVDAISDPAAGTAQSFRLVPKDPAAARDPSVHNLALSAANIALSSRGLYEAPSSSRPDILVEIDYGLGNSIPLPNGPAVVEKFLQLSARRYREDAPPPGRGEEIWNVRTSVADPGTAVLNSLPVLAAVAAEYLARDTHGEQTIKLTDDSPIIARFKEAVQKATSAQSPAEKAMPSPP